MFGGGLQSYRDSNRVGTMLDIEEDSKGNRREMRGVTICESRHPVASRHDIPIESYEHAIIYKSAKLKTCP
jgi:hypothetical protein